MDPRPESGFHLTPQLLMGLLIISIGIIFTLDNLGVTDGPTLLRYWPVGLIAIGLLKAQQARDGGGALAGLLFVVVGGWLLLESFGIVRLSVWELWPVLLVFFGASMVWQGLYGRSRRMYDSTDANATISGLAILGGVSRASNSRTFKGGDLTAILGGCEIDLRQAAIDGEAVLDVFAICGGVEIRVPDDWMVVSRVTPVLGGYDDKTRPPQSAGAHRLVIRGFVIMGGIEVKN